MKNPKIEQEHDYILFMCAVIGPLIEMADAANLALRRAEEGYKEEDEDADDFLPISPTTEFIIDCRDACIAAAQARIKEMQA